ncbi:MAG: hypothetical protein V4579_09885 [Pseudomonadota bacterium]
MLRCSFTFGQLEELLVTVHHIAPVGRVAFQGRLKHLQRSGFPTREKPGKGKAIAYTIEHIFRAVLALELIQAGINPKFAIDMIESNWGDVLPTVYLNSFTGTEPIKSGGGSPDDWCWLIRPEALRGLTVEGESEHDKHEAIEPVRADSLIQQLAIDSSTLGGHLGSHWRNLIINGGPLVRGVMALIELRLGWCSRDDMVADLKTILDEQTARLQAVLQTLGPELADISEKVRADRAARGADRRPYTDLYPALLQAAEKIAGEIPDELVPVLLAAEGAEVQLSDVSLRYLADKRLMQIEAEGLSPTPLYFVLGELLRERTHGDS